MPLGVLLTIFMEDEMNKLDLIIDALEEKDGILYWVKPNAPQVKIGSKAGSVNSDGYVLVKFQNKNYRAHQIIFHMHYGYVPEFLDHIDGNRLNNKIENLRPATSSQNNQNVKAKITNKLGVKGVCIERGKYKANIKINGKSKHLGYFYSLEEAKIVYEEFSKKIHGNYSFHRRPRVYEGLGVQGMDTEIQQKEIDDWLKQSVALVAGSVRGLGTNQRKVRYFAFEGQNDEVTK